MRGKPTALVTLVMFSEFDCVYCKQVTETMTRIRSEYGEKVRFVWKDQPQASHPRSTITANFARAARAQKGDAGFWEVHDKLFVAAKLDDPDLELIAKNASLEVKTAMAAARADAHRKEIDADADLADDVEARGTPHFFVNGRRLVGQQPFEKFKTVLDEEVKKAESIVRGGIATSSLYEWIIKDGRTGEPLHRIVPPNPNAPVRGLATAPVLIQEFGDFQSPPCRRIEPTLEELFKTFPKQIRLAWRDLPLPGSTDAPLAAEAAHDAMVQKGNEAFFKFHGKLFGNQSNLKREDLETYARETGLDLVKFNRALDGHVYRPGLEAEAKVAADASITTAPSFAVGNYILMGPPTYAKLKKLVERVLSEMPSAPYTGPKTGPVASRPAGSGGEKPEPGVVVSGTKFSIVDIVAGTGRAARTGDTVTMHYRGKLLNGAEFDSSHHRSPFSFQLGAGMVIRGWEMGLAGMKTGGKRRITIPPDLAYGNHGSGTSIPANATLVFDVELLSVQ